jgi:hypothetical protein
MLKLEIVEGWNDGLMGSKPNASIFQYSNTPFYSSFSGNFLSSLLFSVFSNLRRAMGIFFGQSQEHECAMRGLFKLRR